MLKKIVFLALLILFFITPPKIFAQENFFVDSEVEYLINESGTTKASFEITLENAGNDLYASKYSLNLKSIKPKNIQAFYKSSSTDIVVNRFNDDYFVEVNFDDIVVGKGKSRSFSITFEEDTFATKTGEIWEISIPRLEDVNTFRKYNIKLSVPTSFGKEAFISPNPLEKTEESDFTQYFFDKETTAESGISAGFGNFQVFTFSLNYHLENPQAKNSVVEIAIPPDTAFQKLYYQNIEPEPEKIRIDDDGNWLASYNLKPNQKQDVSLFGNVQIFSSPIPLSSNYDSFTKDFSSRDYWPVDNPRIIELANKLQTPKAIYEYVSKTLEYDYSRVKPNVERLGALGALNNKNSAICMEYTDLFITLARAAGIPAREVNGYAYTENPEIQPLSLVADVLHSWPEYWNSELNIWVPVDPTWGSTTGGIDYFTRLDLRHFTFVIHGQNSSSPSAPGTYKVGESPKKDVYVTFGQLPKRKNADLQIIIEKSKTIPFIKNNLLMRIENPGPSAVYDIKPTVYFDGKVTQKYLVGLIPPFSDFEAQISIPYSILGTNTPYQVMIVAGGSGLSVPTYKNQVIIVNVTALLLILFLIIMTMMHKAGKLNNFYSRLSIFRKKAYKHGKKRKQN